MLNYFFQNLKKIFISFRFILLLPKIFTFFSKFFLIIKLFTLFLLEIKKQKIF